MGPKGSRMDYVQYRPLRLLSLFAANRPDGRKEAHEAQADGFNHQAGFNRGWTRIHTDDSEALSRAGRSSVASVTSCRVGLEFIRVIREVCGQP